MIRLSFCLRRHHGVSIEEFHRYWLDEHGPLVLCRAAALGIRRYVQGHALAGELAHELRKQRGTSEGFDGIADVWFDSLSAMLRAAASPEGRAALRALLADEKRFIDLASSSVFVVTEHVLVDL